MEPNNTLQRDLPDTAFSREVFEAQGGAVERVIRAALLIGFLVVLGIEAWLLWRALQLLPWG